MVTGFEASGRVNTCRPFGSAYSVMPSTSAMRLMPAGRRGAALAASRVVVAVARPVPGAGGAATAGICTAIAKAHADNASRLTGRSLEGRLMMGFARSHAVGKARRF